MKLVFFSFIFTAIAFSSIGQQTSVSVPTHFARWPYENFYEVHPKGVPCKSMAVKASQGEITQNGCEILYRPDSVGEAVFRVFRKSAHGLRLVDTVEIAVRLNEQVYAILGAHYGGPITKEEAIAVGGIQVREFVTFYNHAEVRQPKSFRVITIHGDSTRSIFNVGVRFSNATLSLLGDLQPNDKLIIANIQARGVNGRLMAVSPAEFTIR